ncbi:MAG: YCF48-related protein, partial [Ignavibacteria bacterium]
MTRFITTIIILIFTFITEVNLYAQLTGGWFAQQTPTNNSLNDVKFFDFNTGIVVGVEGTILKTTDSGNNWNIVESGTSQNLNSISLAGTSNIYIAGDSGIILKSNDYGSSWMLLQSGTINDLKSI